MGISTQFNKIIYRLLLSLILIFSGTLSSAQDSEEETYSISLIQTAETDKEIQEIDNQKVLTETVTVKEGDRIWQIFRERGLLEKSNLPSLLDALKKLNSSLDNLDLIHPGEKIIIPLQISPIAGMPIQKKTSPPVTITPEELKDVDLQNYTIKPGDSIIKVLTELNDSTDEDIYYEYLDLLKNLNPSVHDFDTVYPGQVVRLPIFSPKVIRAPIEPPPSSIASPEQLAQKKSLTQIGSYLGEIFTLLGEEWIDSGMHFIPLKSGGQINLKADSYPIINLSNGNKVIVDLYKELPAKMANLITSSWEHYGIVHLEMKDDLNKAIGRVLLECNYNKVMNSGESLNLGGDIPLTITADWIIKRAPSETNENEGITALTLCDTEDRTPNSIKDFLKDLGIHIIEYPILEQISVEEPVRTEKIILSGDRHALVEKLLTLVGQIFRIDERIQVYQSEGEDLNLIIEADFIMNVGGEDRIIDLSGLDPDIVNMLKEHQFLILELSGEKDSSIITKSALKFLNIPYSSGSHRFLAVDRGDSKNISFNIPGIVFEDYGGKSVIGTPLSLPDQIVEFLAHRGYRVLQLRVEE